VATGVNLMVSTLAPTSSLYIALGDGDPLASERLSIPDQDTVKGSASSVGSRQVRSILTFSPLISSYTLTFNLNFILTSFTISSQISA
jgi:hypothetical protein